MCAAETLVISFDYYKFQNRLSFKLVPLCFLVNVLTAESTLYLSAFPCFFWELHCSAGKIWC